MRRINIRGFSFYSWWICQIWWTVTITYEGIEWVKNVTNTYLWLLLVKIAFNLSCPFTQMCIFKFFTWWLVSITLEVAFGFLRPKFWRWQGPTNGTLLQYMNAGSVVGMPWGGWTQYPTFLQKNWKHSLNVLLSQAEGPQKLHYLIYTSYHSTHITHPR